MKQRLRPEPTIAPGAFVCARCPKTLGASCCEVKPHERLATLTWADVDRIEAATGLSPDAFSEWEWLDADHVQAWLDVHPAYVGYLAAQPRRLGLKAIAPHGAQGLARCALLGKEGCRLSEEARPTACRLYPFDVGEGMLQVERFGDVAEARRLVVKGAAHACLAVEEAKSLGGLMRSFATTAKKLRALVARLREEIAEHARRERAKKQNAK